jgi:hypothetical protein
VASTWQRCEQIVVGQALGNGIDLGIEAIDGLQQGTELFDQSLHNHLAWTDNGLILRECSRIPDAMDTLLDEVCTSDMMLVEKVSSVERLARLTCLSVGQRLKKSQKIKVSLCSNQSSTCG